MEHSNFSVNYFFEKFWVLGHFSTDRWWSEFFECTMIWSVPSTPILQFLFKVLPTKTFNKMRICGVFRPFYRGPWYPVFWDSILKFEILQTTKRKGSKTHQMLNFHPFTTSWQTSNFSCFSCCLKYFKFRCSKYCLDARLLERVCFTLR